MKELLKKYLGILYPGSATSDEETRGASGYSVKFRSSKIKKSILVNYDETVFSIKRTVDFTSEDVDLIEEIVQCVSKFESMKIKDYYSQDLIEKSIDIAVFRHVFKSTQVNYENALRIFSMISDWKNKTYENKQVCFGIQFTSVTKNDERVSLIEILDKDYIAPIADGVSTFLKIDTEGGVIAISSHKEEDEKANIPIRFSGISKVVGDLFLILTTQGDFILAKDGEMRFAKKGNHWVRYNQQSFEKIFVESLAVKNETLKKAIYQTCLDVSFAKSGGLLTIVRKEKGFTLTKIVDDSIIENPKYKLKEKFIHNLIGKNKFHELSRYERKELLALDGSMVISASGQIFGVGIISTVKGGSITGGRAAAASELSKFGTSIKISSDGYLQIFKERHNEAILKIF